MCPSQKTKQKQASKPSSKIKSKNRDDLKHQLLSHSTSSHTPSIAQAAIMKDGDMFLVTNESAQIPAGGEDGFGLYFQDCRFLNRYELTVNGNQLNHLIASTMNGFMGVFELINPRLRIDPNSSLPPDVLGIKWLHVIDGEKLTLDDQIILSNFSLEDIQFPLTLTFDSGFEDIFVVRGLHPPKEGKLVRKPGWEKGALYFVYHGVDDRFRGVMVEFRPAPNSTDETAATFQIKIKKRESQELRVVVTLREAESEDQLNFKRNLWPDVKKVEAKKQDAITGWVGEGTKVQTDNSLLSEVLTRSLSDIRTLRCKFEDAHFISAGVPWFVTLFGRDSIIASLQTLAYHPEIAKETLEILARYQGKNEDQWRDEQPGKILHELRRGELAAADEVPQSPYYGTVDATPLFLILMCRYVDWTGDVDTFENLRENVERALQWIDEYGDSDGDGYTDYRSKTKNGLVNQGWKDSGNAIVNSDGSLAKPPIALVEVQGYVYLAKKSLAKLYRYLEEPWKADQLDKEAEELRQRFNRDFWLEDKGYYALALQAGRKEPAAVLSSNAGQALWSGIADPDKAESTIKHLMSDDMYSHWGIRTLSNRELRYNPVSYHLGSVWPHDNGLIAAGFRHYGFDDEALTILRDLSEAAQHFRHYRIPELFCGFHREDYGAPVRYPVACHPQAWGAGAIPYLLRTMLGLIPEGLENRLSIVKPRLLHNMDYLILTNLHVGRGSVDLKFTNRQQGPAHVEVMKVEGDLEVKVES